MDTIFGIPADTLLIICLVMLGLIFVGFLLTTLRYPIPFRIGLRNITRRKSQTALIIGGLALSTVIITSALGIGDTIAYSIQSGVYEELGNIDEEISASERLTSTGFGFGNAGPSPISSQDSWFEASIYEEITALVDGALIDGSAALLIQKLPVVNGDTKLSEAAVEIRGLGSVYGDGLSQPTGIENLSPGEVIINTSLATVLDADEGDQLLLMKGAPTTVSVTGIVPDGELAGSSPAVIWGLAEAQTFFNRPGELTSILVSNTGDVEQSVELTDAAIKALQPVTGDLLINPVKADQLEAAASSAEFLTTLFVTFGTFSIFSGILLIFLIFSVLAAERKSELGMGRAVGMQRSDLVRQFVTEGLAYNFVAALIGATVGVLLALLLAETLATLFSSNDINVTPRVSLRSALIGYSMGLIVTFVTVSIAAIRISKINIIAAIRDLNIPSLPREGQWTLFLRPFTVWQAAADAAGKGNRREALRLFLFAGPKTMIAFWSGLLARGPLLMVLGYLLAFIGVNLAKQSGVYGLGVSLFIIGLGQLAAWLILSERIAYSLTGLSLILYWSLPTRSVGALADLGTNPGDFFISGMFLVAGAIVLFLYNADSLLNVFSRLIGRGGRLLPVARISVAYPVKAKGRTATMLAMFSLVVFTLVGTTTITNTFSNFLNTETGSGGFDILVQTNPFNPLNSSEFGESIQALSATGAMPEPSVLAAAIFAPVLAQSPNMVQPASYAVNGVDDIFLATQQLELSGIAQGYENEAQVWAALKEDPTVVVIDSFSINRGGDPTFQASDEAFAINSIDASASRFEPVEIQITGSQNQSQEFTVIGVLGSAPSFFGAMMNEKAANNLGFSDTNRYFIGLDEGSDAQSAANTIESTFNQEGLQTTLLKNQLEASRESIRSIFYLIQGFIGLGLLIGIAALGVVTIRAVIERRQQIGVLRAIGFQRDMVQGVFVLEGIFISGLGIIIGYSLALAFAYNLYLQVAADQGLAFLPPWLTLTGIAFAILIASLLTAWIPARSTSKVVIAEALRYE